MKKTIFLILNLTLYLCTTQTYAGKYVLEPFSVYSFGVSTSHPRKVKNICQLYMKEVIEYNDHKPLVCERTFNPKAHGFSRPKWIKLDTEEAIEHVNKVIHYGVNQIYSLKNKPKKRAAVLKDRLLKEPDFIRNGKLIFKTATFDVDNDGALDVIVRSEFPEQQCNNYKLEGGHFSYSFKVMNSLGDINEMKTRSIGLGLDVMLVNGYTYFDRWSGTNVQEKTDGVIIVYEPAKISGDRGIGVMPVCKFKYYK